MKRLAVFLACLSLIGGPVMAQSPSQPNYPTNITQGSNKTVPGNVCMYYAPSLGYAVPCSTDNPLPISGTFTTTPGVVDATSTDASGTVTLGGTYQTVIASNATRKGCLIQNPTTATEVLSVKVGTMAAPFTIAAGGSLNCGSPGGVIATDTITVTAATTGHAFSAVYQ